MRNLCFIAVAIFFSTNLVHGGPYSIDCYDSREALKFIPPDWEPPEGPYVRTAEGPPASPAEGQSSLWYLWYFGGGPPHSESHQCTIRGGNDSDNVWVVVDDRIWNVSIDQTDVDLIIENFDNSSPGPLGTGIYDIDTNAFGDVPLGYDNHPKVYLLYYEFNISSDGFFWYFDTEEDGTYPYGSNQCEVLYLNCGPSHDPSSDYMLGVVAHEFVHLIAYDKDPDESNWMDETLAEIGMALYGDTTDLFEFVADPNVTLTLDNVMTPPPRVSYGARMAYGMYFWEKYGQNSATLALTANLANDDAGIDTTLAGLGVPMNFEETFGDWIVANYLNDTTVDGDRFRYDYLPIGSIAPDRVETAVPVSRASERVQIWAAKYHLFQNLPQGIYNVAFDGDGSSALSDDHFYASLVSMDSSGTSLAIVDHIGLDTAMDGSGQIVIDQDYDSFVLVVGAWTDNVVRSSPWDCTFSYSVDMVTPIFLTVANMDRPPPLNRDIHLTWTGGGGPYDVYRSDDPETILDSPDNIIVPGTMGNDTWDMEVPAIPRVFYYRVEYQ